MGLFGGTLFLGAFYLAATGPWRANKDGALDDSPNLKRMYPYVIAMVVAYAAGCYSLTRNFVVPTYLVLGLATAFMSMAYSNTPDWFCINQRLVKRLCVVGVCGFVFLKLFTQYMTKYG
jgi:putative inorganic carbon (hco3(-)) transporter